MHFANCELNTPGAAYDPAWGPVLRTGMTTPNLYEAREILARRIVLSLS